MTTEPTTPTSAPQRRPIWQRALAWLVVALVLLAVFGLYLDPDFMLTIAEQTWACFYTIADSCTRLKTKGFRLDSTEILCK